MTPNTEVYIHDPVDYRDVFIKCNQLLGAHEGTAFTEDAGSISNKPAQGLPAWLFVYHGDNGPLVEPGRHSEYCDGGLDGCPAPCAVPCWIEVSFDTTYGYQGPDGGCGDLHARLTAELGRWLDGKGVSWSWRNEFTSEVHAGYAGLTELGAGGLAALDWFTAAATTPEFR